VYGWGSKEGLASVLGSTLWHSKQKYMLLRPEQWRIIKKGYKDRNIHILSDNQTAIMALHNLETNSNIVWDCHQFLVELANRKGSTGMGAGTLGN
jgi:hypothetical protein